MKTKRYSTEQIIGILKEADDGMPVKELCRKYGISDAAYGPLIGHLKSRNSGLFSFNAINSMGARPLKE